MAHTIKYPPPSKALALSREKGVPPSNEKYLHDNANRGVGLDFTGWGVTLNALLHFLGYIPSALVLVGIYLGGDWNWLTFVAGWVIVPIIDLILGADKYNLTQTEETEFRASILFRIVTWFHFPIQVALVSYSLYYIHTTQLTWSSYIGLLLSVGTVEGFGIGCVHELIHRPQFIDFASGVASLIYSNYGHFWIEHLWGHHKNVATRLDPASSEIGDNIYTFLPRCLWLSWVEANTIEANLQRRAGHWAYGPFNRIIQSYIVSWSIAAFYGYIFSPRVVPFFLLQGFIAACIVENTNFIEHYGLRRKELSDGEFEPVGWFHSWDTPAVLTNYILFKIQRHPDHHTNAGRPYQILRTIPEAPKIPTGYAGMIALSWFPPLHQYVMDWRAFAYSKQAHEYFEKGSVNGIDPFPKERRAVASRFDKIDFQVLPKGHFVAADKEEEKIVKQVLSESKKID